MGCNHCEEFSRSELVRRAVAEAGRGLPAIEPRDAGAGRAPGSSRRSFLLRSSAAMLSRLRRLEAAASASFEEGIAQAAGGDDRVLVSVFLDGGVDSLSVLAPIADPSYRALRPKLALPEGAGPPFTEDPRLHWNPAAAALRRRCTGRARCRCSRRSATRAPTSRTSPRATTGRSAALQPREDTGWLGRLLDVIGTPDNPLQGLSLDGSLSPAWRPRRCPVAAIDGPSYDLWAPRRLGRARGADVRRRSASSAAGAAVARTSARGPPATRRRQAMPLKAAARRRSRRGDHPPGRLPGATASGSARASPALAAMLAAGLPIRCAAISAPGRLRHPRRARPRASTPTSSWPPTRSPPSSATSRRAGSPTGC